MNLFRLTQRTSIFVNDICNMKILLTILFVLTVYLGTLMIFYKGIRNIFFRNSSGKKKLIWLLADIIISITIIGFITIYYIQVRNNPSFISFTKLFYCVSIFFLTFIPKLVFSIIHIILYLLKILFRKLIQIKGSNRLTLYVSFVISVFVFGLILHGIIYGKTNFKVRKASISSNKLPKSFNNLKIVQISDIHIGSFCNDTKTMKKVVEKINELEPDLVFLTGDLVNNFANEADSFDIVFSKISAKLGKYASLGNHDFGDYTVWRTPETKNTNLVEITNHYSAMGFTLLRNESTYLVKGDDSISIAGVDSWGLPPFKQYGDVMKAIHGISKDKFILLLSHDPSYWGSVIKYMDQITVTFSGHTHGMQVGLEFFGLDWSPIKYRYPEWGGLYSKGENYLYVNRGLGFIGFTGRIGMAPEITLFEIKSK